MRMEEKQAEEYCRRTGQMEKLAAREGPKKEYPKYQDIEIKEQKPTKYGNIPTEVNEILFQSKKEANCYVDLLMQQRCGLIEYIKLQPVYMLQEGFKKNGKTYRAITYVADFEVKYKADEKPRVIDTKSRITTTPVFRLKQKLFEKRYPELTIEIV